MKKKVPEITGRKSYTPEFKKQAIALADELDSIPDAADKLGIKSVQTLSSWIRHAKKKTTDSTYSELLEAKEELKRVKKELEKEKKITAILRDATVFFSQESLK